MGPIEDNHKLARLIGQITGVALVGCGSVCVCGIAIALTVKLLLWIF